MTYLDPLGIATLLALISCGVVAALILIGLGVRAAVRSITERRARLRSAQRVSTLGKRERI